MNKNTWIAVAVIVVVIIIGFFAFGQKASAPQVQRSAPATTTGGQTETGVPSYMSADDNFSVNFPVTPQMTKTTFKSPTAGSIPRTEYVAQSSSGYYITSVYHYPKTYQFSSGYLAGALQLFMSAVNAKYPGAKLVSQSPAQFLGNPAITATISVTIAGEPATGYLLVATKNQNTYGIGTYDVNQTDYDAFINSFSFTQ